MKVTLSADSDTPIILCLALASALESFQCLYSVYLETAFPLQRSQGQWAWAYGKAAQKQYEMVFLLQPPSMQYAHNVYFVTIRREYTGMLYGVMSIDVIRINLQI